MITFTQARRIAEQRVAPTWDPQLGTMYADTVGYEDANGFAVTVGPEEWLVDGDVNYLIADGTLVLVNHDGRAEVTTHLLHLDRLDKMRRVTDE